MKFGIIAFAAVLSWSAFAGDNGGGNVECKSDSGRTVVAGGAGVPYNGVGPADLNYAIDGHGLHFSTRALSTGGQMVDYVVYEHKKMYAVGFKRTAVHSGNVYSEDVFQMRSIGGTFKQIRPDVFAFKAVIPAYTSLDPRLGGDSEKSENRFDKDIQVNCVLDISL